MEILMQSTQLILFCLWVETSVVYYGFIGFLQHGISQSNNSLKDTHWWSLSSRCEDLLAADIKSQEQEIKQMDNDSCQFAFWREKTMVLHPSADFLIKGVNTMVTLHLYTIWIQDCAQISCASHWGPEHLDYCLLWKFGKFFTPCAICIFLFMAHSNCLMALYEQSCVFPKYWPIIDCDCPVSVIHRHLRCHILTFKVNYVHNSYKQPFWKTSQSTGDAL